MTPIDPTTLDLIPMDPSTSIAILKSECSTLISSVTTPVLTLTITTPDSYTIADSHLTKIRDASKLIGPKLDAKIVPIRSILDQWYALRRDLTGELDQAEQTVKGMMNRYKLEEQRKERELAVERQRETERLSKEAEAALTVAQDTTTDAITRARAKLQAKASVVKAEEVRVATTVVPTRAPGSSWVAKEEWEVQDIKKLLQGILDGIIPIEMVEVHRVKVNAMWRISKGKVKGWPGVGVVDGGGVRGR